VKWFNLVPALVLIAVSGANAAPITVERAYQFLDNRSTNDAGIGPGVRVQFGAGSVSPAEAGGTTAVGTSGGLTRQISNIDYTLFNGFYASTVSCPGGICPSDAYDPWTMTFSNGADQTVVQTQGLSETTPLPFVTNVLLDPNGAGGPTLSWGLPNVAHDAVAVRVRDNTVRVGPGQLPCSTLGNSACVADLLSVNYFPAGTTSIAIPGALYQPGKDYSIEINVIDLRGSYIASGPGRNGLMFADTQRMSRSYIDAAVLPSGAPAAYLPTPFLLPDGAPAYSFQIGGIVNGQPIFIDPLIAIGYDYAVGAGDPFFASVLLPTGIGDDLYDIIVDNISYSVMGGVVFDFTQIAAGGVDAFRVLGIETDAMLDPFSSTAFVTGLTFVADGSFTGTMTPITQFVPVLSPLSLAVAGLLPLMVTTRRRPQDKTY